MMNFIAYLSKNLYFGYSILPAKTPTFFGTQSIFFKNLIKYGLVSGVFLLDFLATTLTEKNALFFLSK